MLPTETVTRIDALTPEQKAQLGPWADRWIEVGLCTDPADFDRWERGARRAYEFAGIPWPRRVVRVSSPLVGALAASIAEAIWRQRRKNGDDAVRGALGRAVGGALDDAVGDAVGGAVGGAVHGAVHGALDDAVDGAVGDASWHPWRGGQFWSAWVAWGSFFTDVCGLQLRGDANQRMEAWKDVTASCSYWWPNQEFVIVCDRPSAIHLEQVGPRGWRSHRLHNDSGPAISFRDGWSLWFLHGVRVTEQIVMAPDTLTPEQIKNEDNAEVRRVMIDRFGRDRFRSEVGAVMKARDDFGTLWALPDDDDIAICEVIDATANSEGKFRTFDLLVPAEMRTPHEAVAATFGMDADEYAPSAQS